MIIFLLYFNINKKYYKKSFFSICFQILTCVTRREIFVNYFSNTYYTVSHYSTPLEIPLQGVILCLQWWNFITIDPQVNWYFLFFVWRATWNKTWASITPWTPSCRTTKLTPIKIIYENSNSNDQYQWQKACAFR